VKRLTQPNDFPPDCLRLTDIIDFPRALNRHRLDAELGCGGMGAVYRAYATLLDRRVALMVIATQLKSQ
jgi:hypothetical protein